MRNATNVEVKRAIVHVVDNRENEPFLSAAELPLAESRPLGEYFSSQVVNALHDAQTVSALFSTDAEPTASRQCFRILKDGDSFIPASQELARLLFAAMGTDRRIAPGSLAVCTYIADNYPGIDFLALIKIDPSRALVQKVGRRDGKRIVSFDVNDLVMPTAREKLQKAALIPPPGKDKSFDLLLLDRQVATVAADFFAYKFLNSITAREPKEMTNDFYIGALNAYNRLVNSPARGAVHVTLEDAEGFRDHIEVALQSPSVDLDEWVTKLPLPEEAKSVVREEMEKKLPQEKQVAIEQNYARVTLLKKKRFRGEFGVLFEVESDHYRDVVIEESEEDRPDGKRITRLVIEVPTLQWVKR
jgi:hypothetical protein